MSHASASRRGFLQAAAGAAAAPVLRAEPASPKLPAVRFGEREVTRLIVGTNPFFGYSHFNGLLDKFMREYMTQERRLEVLRRCEEVGINTWQLHYSSQTMADLKLMRAAGGKLNWFLLGEGEMQKNFDLIPEYAKLGPIGIAHHGNRTDERFRERKMDSVKDFCKRVRDAGVLVGVSMHNPDVLDYVEDKGWDVDYYMTCMYRVSRTKEETRAVFGEAPLGEAFFEKDPERMCAKVRQTSKPCLAFKVLGAGRNVASRETVEAAFRFVFSSIKPTDAVIVGMCPKFKDEPLENAEIVRSICRVNS